MFARFNSDSTDNRHNYDRVSIFLFVMVFIGTICQIIGCFAPGWYIIHDYDDGSSQNIGLWFETICKEVCDEGECHTMCTTKSQMEIYLENRDKNPAIELNYIFIVQDEVTGVLSVMGCILSCILSFINIIKRSYRDRLQMATCLTLLISGCLIWSVIGPFAAQSALVVKLFSYNTVQIAPYSLILSAIGSGLTIAVGVMDGILCCKRMKPITYEHLNSYEEHLNTTSNDIQHLNTTNNDVRLMGTTSNDDEPLIDTTD